MRGIDQFNFPAFESAEESLLNSGYDVTSPHRLDLEAGFDPMQDSSSFFSEECVRRDIEAIFSVDALVFLPGWEGSKGARAERALAEWLEKKCYTYPDFIEIT